MQWSSPMQLDQFLSRALSAVNKGTKYGLGKGGINPASGLPSAGGRCDCTGFVSWAWRMSRLTHHPFYVHENGGWIETTACWKDIGTSVGFLEPAQAMRPGCILVYPDHVTNGVHHEGHIAIVATDDHRIVHCSVSNDNSGDAIQLTAPTAFTHNSQTRIGWYAGIEH